MDDHDHSQHDHSSHRHGHGHSHGHDHSHGGGHSHGAGHVHGGGNKQAVLIGFLLTAGFMIAEVIGGYVSGSLALIADAGHMLTDAAALGLAWLGFRMATKQPDERRSFGYARFEVLAGFVNALALFGVTIWIVVEAVQRINDPHPVLAGPMLAIAVLGLLVNCLVFAILMRADREHLNIRAAIVHVAGDLLGSVAAIVAAGVIWVSGWTPIDPILSVLVSLLILRSAWALLTSSLHILLEGVPEGLDAARLEADIAATVPGVIGVHHVHLWSLSSGKTLATLHVDMAEGGDQPAILRQVKTLLTERYAIGHTTIQIESAGACVDKEFKDLATEG